MTLSDFEVNGELLPARAIRERASELRREYDPDGQALAPEYFAQIQQEALELLIDRMLLVQEAGRLGLTPGQAELDEMRDRLAGRYDGVAGCRAGSNLAFSDRELGPRMMVDRILDRWRAGVRRPRAEEVTAYYKAHKDQFFAPERVNVAHIVRSAERYPSADEARAAMERLRERAVAGEDFAALARDYSDCPENGGELGWVPQHIMVEDFDRVVFSSPVGQFTPVFETCFGFHFAMVRERNPAGIQPLSDVRGEIEESLWLAKQDREVGRRLSELRSRAVIKKKVS